MDVSTIDGRGMMLGEMTHWSDWVAVGIFGLFLLAAIGHLIQVFTGPQRLRAFIMAGVTPIIGAIIAVLVGALLHPGEGRQEATPPAAASQALPTPDWARELVPKVETWAARIVPGMQCAALDWQQRRYIHCVKAPYDENVGRGLDIIFRLKDGVLYPVNGTTFGILREKAEKGELPAVPGFTMRVEFLRDGGPIAGDVFEEIRRRLVEAARRR